MGESELPVETVKLLVVVVIFLNENQNVEEIRTLDEQSNIEAGPKALLNVETRGYGDCWETWSRCTRWSMVFTGILWQNCNDRCICKGARSGACRLSPSKCPLSNKAYTCVCSGRRSGS